MAANSGFPGEFEAVVVRMPVNISHSAIVNLHIARVINRGAKSFCELGRYDDTTKKYKKLSSNIEKAINIINKYEPVSIIDKVMSQLVNIGASKTVIASFARELLNNESSVQCKKVGIALLGTFGMGKDITLISGFEADEEYTFYVVKALKQLMGEGEEYIIKLVKIATKTSGWGKIAAILELPDKISNNDVRLFLLQNGTENDVGKYLIAVECAIKGRLYDYLEVITKESIKPEKEMQEGICNIFEGLIEAENEKDADSFGEIEGINKIIENYCASFEKGLFDINDAEKIYNNLKSRI